MNFVFNVFSSSSHQSLHRVVNEMFSHKFSMCWNIGLSIKYVMNQDALHSPSAKALSNVILLGINLRAYIFCSFPFCAMTMHCTLQLIGMNKRAKLNPTISIERRKRNNSAAPYKQS
jgi:hypothetical protein